MPQSKSYTSFNNLAIRLYVEHLITEDQNSHCRNDLATKTFGHNIDAWQLIGMIKCYSKIIRFYIIIHLILYLIL